MANKDINHIIEEMLANPHRAHEIFKENKEAFSKSNNFANDINDPKLLQYLSLFPENQFSKGTLTFNTKVNFKEELEFEILKQSIKNGNQVGIFHNLTKQEQEKVINFLKENSANEEFLSRVQEHFNNENDSKNDSKNNAKPKFK